MTVCSRLVGRLARLVALVVFLAAGLPATLTTAAPPLTAQAETPAPHIVVPAGFRASVLTWLPEDMKPTSLAYGPDGALYIASVTGPIYRLTDDGVLTPFTENLRFPLGIAWRGNELYFSSTTPEVTHGRVGILRDTNGDHKADDVRYIIDNLPIGAGARHLINGIAFGPDDKLYITNGSLNNTQRADDPRSATIQSYNPDGTIPADNPNPGSPVIATSLRNPYDLAFHPIDGTLFSSDNGRDDLGDNFPPEKLLHIIPGRDYGWPECFGINRGRCEGSQPPIAELDPHVAPSGMAFYTGNQFGPDYQNDLFLTLYGAGNPGQRPHFGRTLEHIELTRRGETYDARVRTFARGFERPVDVITAKSGGLLVADFGPTSGGTGLVYHIQRDPSANPFAPVPVPAGDNAPVYVGETGQTVAADFLEVWQGGGGLTMFGYPVSQEFIEDGKVVQYFERARFERQLVYQYQSPERAEMRVFLGLLGKELVAGRQNDGPFMPTGSFVDSEDRRYFPETAHSLAYGFKRYWDEHGGLTVFGFPISEEFTERNPDTGEEHTVQYFERARFEYHPELAGTPYEVLQGRLGAQIAAQRYPGLAPALP